VIDARNFPPPPAGQTEQQFDLRVAQHQEVIQPDAAYNREGVKGGGRVVSRLTWIANGCRRTGTFVKIKEKKYEICEDAGAFGSIVEHFGTVAVGNWVTTVEGKGVAGIGNLKNVYRISVPKDGVTELKTVYLPVEKKKGCFAANVPAVTLLLFGVVVVGLKTYRPRRKNNYVV